MNLLRITVVVGGEPNKTMVKTKLGYIMICKKTTSTITTTNQSQNRKEE